MTDLLQRAGQWPAGVLDFWFGLTEAQHWRSDPEIDAAIRRRFGPLWNAHKDDAAETFLKAADIALAAIILFDQFPRNMFRGERRSFATDPLAQAIARAAISRGYDQQVPAERRHFFYMPLQHSEAPADQERCVALFERLGNANYLDYARKHRDVIARFGRFPHRNALLGRPSTEAELAFGLEQPW